MLAAREILDQAHDKAPPAISLNDQGWNLVLTQGLVSLESALTAHEFIALAVRRSSTRNSDWFLEADLGDVLNDLPKDLLVAYARINNGDPIDRDELSLRTGFWVDHAASRSRTLAAIPNRGSRLSKR